MPYQRHDEDLLISLDIPNPSIPHNQIYKVSPNHTYVVCKEIVEKMKVEESKKTYDENDPFLLYVHAYSLYLMGNSCFSAEEKQFLYNQCDTKTRQAISLVEISEDAKHAIIKVKLHYLLARSLLQNTINFKIEQTGNVNNLALNTTDISDKFFQEVCVTMDKAQQLLDKCSKMYSNKRDANYKEALGLTGVMHFHFGKILTEWSTFRRQRWEPLCDKAKACFEQCLAWIEQNEIRTSNLSVMCLEELGTLQLYQIRRRRELSTIYGKSGASDPSKKSTGKDPEDIKLIDKCIETWEKVIEVERLVAKQKTYEINEENNLRCAMALFEKASTIIPSVSLIFELHTIHDSIYDDDKIASMLTRSYNVHDLTFKNKLISDRNLLLTKFSDRMKQLEQHKANPLTAPLVVSPPVHRQSVAYIEAETSVVHNLLLGDSDLMLRDSQVTLRNQVIEKAVKVLEEVLKQNPNNTAILLSLGRMEFEMGAVRAIQTHFNRDCNLEFDAAANRLLSLNKNAKPEDAPKVKLSKALLGEIYFYNAKGRQSIDADQYYAKAADMWTECVSDTLKSKTPTEKEKVVSSRSNQTLVTRSRDIVDLEKNELEFRDDIKEILKLTRDIRSDNVLIDGEMIKLGGVRKNWNIRYFTLTAEQLSYYDNRKTMKLKKRVATSFIKSVAQSDTTKNAKKKPYTDFPHMLEVQAGRRTFYIGFKQQSDLQAWQEILQYIIDHKKTASQRRASAHKK